MTNEEFNHLIGIKESYEMPEKLMEILTGENVIDFYEKLLNLDLDLSKDVLRDYFQAEHGDRGKLKQDYTPDCVCELVRRLSGDDEDTLDICAGTGALTIACGRSGEHRCEEVSERAIPVLLCNLGIRGMRGTVSVRDILTGQTKREYKMIPAGRFTRPELTEETHTRKWKRIVSNPPYSLKFQDVDKSADDPRFSYGLTPSGFSDYLFIQDAISRLDEDGTLVEILTHGVLFRGKREATIRKKLIDANLIDAIIGLPDNLFMNTGIPVLLMILKKGRNRDDILMVDASKECVKEGKVNIMTPEQINRVCSAVNIRRNIDKLSHVTTIERAKKGKRYPGRETLIELSGTKGAARFHSSEGEVSTRYAVITSKKEILPEYLFLVIERGLPKFVHKYLTTINLQIDTLNNFEIEYHESVEEQRKIVEMQRKVQEAIEAEEREIEKLKAIKSFYMKNLFVEERK